MRTVTITVGTGAQGVTIGRRAENEATAVIFDVSALIETYGDGGAVLMVKRPTDADAYPATVERSGTSVTWTPTDTDLAYKGMGEAELFWYADGMLAKTAVYTINIRRDIGETTGEAPAPYDDWIATLTELGGQTAENAQRAEVARAAAETAAATATSAANTANTAAERAESAANNAEQDAASTAADRTAAEDAAARAATSATAATQSASAAATSAGQAGLSANSAAASATSAAQSASDAQAAVASIGDSVTRAESAASTATGAASAATTKASEANTSAGVAASNATTATVKAQEAAQSATQAAQSATTAQTAQTAAEAAQTGAQTAQTAAESAAASAEAEADRAEGYADRLIDVYPTDTASGSIASFPDGADSVPVKSLKLNIEPVQDLHGYDNPWPAGGGENVLDPNLRFTAGTYYGGVVLSTSDGYNISFSGTPTESGNIQTNNIPTADAVVMPAGTYTSVGAILSTYKPDGSWYANRQVGTWTADESFIIRAAYIQAVAGNPITGSRFIALVKGSAAPAAWSPYSNLCPISGWTGADVTAAGKNLLNLDESKMVSVSWDRIFPISLAEGNYVISRSGVYGNGYGTKVIFTDSDGNTIATAVSAYSFGQAQSNTSFTFSLTRAEAIKITKIRLQANNSGITFADIEAGKLMIEPGSTASAYEPYSGETYNITFPSEAGTVYGGTVDVVSGEMVVDNGQIDMGDIDWRYNASWGGYPAFYAYQAPTNIKPTTASSEVSTAICEMYETVSRARLYGNNITALCIPIDGKVSVRDSRFTDAASFKAAVTGVKLVYPLATPIEYTLTPAELTTLLGQNNIFADCGPVDVEYRADIALYIDKKLAQVLNA